VLCREQFGKKLDSEIFPGIQGGPLMHVIAAKAVAFRQAQTEEFKTYQQQIVKNSKRLAAKMQEKGYRIVSGGTDTHLTLVDLTSRGITGKEAQDLLGTVNITVNKNLIPYDRLPPGQASGIRLGTPAVTSRGMNEAEIEKIADFIDRAIASKNDPVKLEKIKSEVSQLTGKFPLYPELKE
jgi:glycine hydroxymethyltransferase